MTSIQSDEIKKMKFTCIYKTTQQGTCTPTSLLRTSTSSVRFMTLSQQFRREFYFFYLKKSLFGRHCILSNITKILTYKYETGGPNITLYSFVSPITFISFKDDLQKHHKLSLFSNKNLDVYLFSCS